MAKDEEPRETKGPTREAQLAAALRANLRRRKAAAANPPAEAAKKDAEPS